MGAVWMVFRAEARKRWRAWTLLALVLGVVGGSGIAAAAGARRTDTAYPRFVARNAAVDVMLGGIGTDDPAEARAIFASIIRLPEVEAYTGGGFLVSDRATVLPSRETFAFPEVVVVGEPTAKAVRELNRPKVVRGRLFSPDASDEAVVDFTVADRLHLGVGAMVELPLRNQETGAEAIRVVRIVGVVAAPWDFPAVGQTSFAGMVVSPGFVRANAAYIQESTDAPSVKLRHGAADIASFVAAVTKQAAKVDIPGTLPQHLAGVRKTLRFEVSALWLLAGIIAVAALAIVGQALARQALLDAEDDATLRAVAMSRRQLFASGMIRAAAIGLGAAVVSVGVALLASPLTPRGLARVVEPDPGFAADWTALAIGAAAMTAIALLASAIPAWRAAGARAQDAPDRGSRAARGLANAGASPSIVAGVRLALEPGHGRRALPVRSTIIGISVALAAFWGAATFTKSLDHLIASPGLQGFAWDVITTGPTEVALAGALRRDPDVVAAVPGGATNIVIGGRHLIPFTYAPGDISPVILEGHAPATGDEIALGPRALRAFRKHVGDTVTAVRDTNEPGAAPQTFRIVGTTVVPSFFFQQVEPGFGSAITIEGYERLDPEARKNRGAEGLPYIIRYRPGVDVRAKLATLRKDLGTLFTFQIRQPELQLSGVSRSSGLPLTLTEILLFLAAATLVHALVSAVRKRRHDLAILKTLGFSRRQIWTTVAWQASTFVVLGLAIGLPLGTGLGRWAWTWFVGTLGLVPATVLPSALVVVLVVIATIAFGNLTALLPARAAARTRPALVLRTE